MATDPTEAPRRNMVAQINAEPLERDGLEQLYGKVWDTSELQEDFTVNGFMAPYVGVSRKEDGLTGTLMFQHSPRFYFKFKESE